MENETRMKGLKVALLIVGLLFTFGIYPLMTLFPESWGWTPPQHEYEQMIVGLYVTLGLFLIYAAKDPMQHLSLIWFAIWSSFVHATIMLVQALLDPTEHANLYGDVPGLYIIAVVLALLMPRKIKG